MSSLSFNNTIPPLGLAYISAATKGAGHEVQIIDAPGEDRDRVEPLPHPQIRSRYAHGLPMAQVVVRIDPRAQVIGITHMSPHEWPLMRELVQRIRVRHPRAFIVLGGET